MPPPRAATGPAVDTGDRPLCVGVHHVRVAHRNASVPPRSTAFAITYAHLRDPVPALTARVSWLPTSLNAVFAKALAKDPAGRYRSCVEFTDIVSRTLRGVEVPEVRAARRRRLRPLNDLAEQGDHFVRC